MLLDQSHFLEEKRDLFKVQRAGSTFCHGLNGLKINKLCAALEFVIRWAERLLKFRSET